MKGFNKLAHKITNLFLALFIITAQLFAPIGALVPNAAAAVVPTNKTSFDSFPFNLSGTYSEPGGQPTSTGSFSNGNVGPYVEGACIPSIIEVTNNSTAVGDIPVSPIYDFLSNHTAIENLEMVGDSGTAGNVLTNPRAVADNLNDFTYPGTSLAAATSFYSSGGTVTVTSAGPYSGNNNGTSGVSNADTFRHYNLVLKDVDPDETVYVVFCARLGVDASEYNGSSLSIRTAQGGQENIPIPVNALLRRPSITITKTVVGGSALPSDFSFNVSPAINGQSLFNIPVGQNSVTIDNIFPDGSFTITENTAVGYSFTSGSGTNCTFNGSTATATVTAAKNPTNATCSFTNSQLPGKIIVIKQTLPDGDGQSFNFTANYDADGFSLSDGQQNDSGNLASGTYSVSETVPTGWDLTSATCSDGSPISAIAVGAGETVTCTFTNTKRGHLIVQKTTFPSGDLTNFSINATGSGTITGGGSGTISDANDQNYEVTPGTYSVSETLPAGWSKDESDCQDVVVAAGATEYCTVINTKLATIRIIKDALPNHSDNFSFLTETLPGGNFTLDDDSGADGADATYSNLATFSDLTPNTAYSVSESSLSGWQLTDLDCDTGNFSVNSNQVTITPTPGQTITCTFENTKLRSITGTKYTSDADSSLGPVLSGWTIFIDENNNGELDPGEASDVTDVNGDYSFDNLLPGNYILKEVLMSGWTQIFGPNPVDLTYNADSTDNDFGNFQNASISGFKWNDKNADDVVDQDENKLDGWTITLYDENDVNLGSIVTAGGGNYTFTNLAPGTYAVCETQQTGWVQTFPDNNACHTIVIDESGETNQANFGNQGRGTVTVIKHVDTDGDGQVNNSDVTTWTWDIDGGGNFATGSSNSQNVAAGTYTVSEDQQTNYHVTSSSCSGETPPQAPSTSLSATVSPGENVTCTFTNTRDTGTITVNKVVDPTNDTGLFNLQINDQTAGTGANVGHGGTTGAVQVVTGNYTIGETAGTSTSLADYTTNYSCVNQDQITVASGSTTTSTSFAVNSQDSIVCTITNTRLGKIIVAKETNPDGSEESFEFDTSYDFANFPLKDGESNDSGNLLPGNYSVSEVAEDGWDLTSVVCSDGSDPSSINLAPGETVTCTFTNTQDANIIVIKQTDPDGDQQSFSFNASYDQDGFSLKDDEQNDSGDLDPGIYSVSENVPAGWDLETATCSDRSNPGSISLEAGETVTCTFTNEKDAKIIVVKETNPDGSQQSFSFNASYDGDGFSLKDGEQNDSGDLDPGIYSVSENVPGGWDLDNVQCSDGSDSSAISLSAGEIVTCTFTNEEDANIVVVKQTNPDGSTQNFNFTASYDGDGFSLSDGQSNNSGDLDPGVYSVSETVPSGWDLDSVVCSDGSDPDSINLSAGETVTCTFTNEQDANIVVVKQTDPDGDTQSFSFNASYDGDGFSLSDGQQNDSGDLDPGIYSVSENVPAGWDLETATCSDGSQPDSIDLAAGETVTCTFTNEKDAFIIIQKETNPDGSQQSFSFNASYDGDGFNLSDGQSNNSGDLDPGTYSVSENVPTGWDLEDVTCSDESDPSSINLSAGETVTCTFTNEQDANIVVVKQTDPDGDPQSFDFTATYDQNGFSLSDGQQNDSGDLDPGIYSVSENVPAGWDLENVTCSDGSNPANIDLSAGETVTCTFTNEKDANIVVVKETNPGDDENEFVFIASYDVDGFYLSDGQQNDSGDLDPGTYSVSEVVPTGWDLTEVFCSDESDPENINLSAGETVTCTFTNTKRASVTIIKFNDANQNGVQDSGEETLSGWEMSLDNTKQLTGQDGSTTFENIVPNQQYTVSETQQSGWTFSSISCNGVETSVTSRENPSVEIFPVAGETVVCKVGNTQPAVLAETDVAPLAETGQPGVTSDMYIAAVLMSLAVATLFLPTNSKKSYVTISLRRLNR